MDTPPLPEEQKYVIAPWKVAVMMVTVFVLMGGLVLFAEFWEPDHRVDIPNKYEQPPANALQVLFIGNSHLYVNNIPRQVQEIAAHSPGAKPVFSEDALYPGVTLAWHTRNDLTVDLLSRKWDAVVIQERSLEAFDDPRGWRAGTEGIRDMAKAGGTERFIYIETWARHNQDVNYKTLPDRVGENYAQQQAMLARVIAEHTDALKLEKAPVGTAWARLYPKMRLHADTNHTNVAGSYLVSLIIHRALQPSVRAKDVTWAPGSLDQDTAALLRAEADAAFASAKAASAKSPEEPEESAASEDASASSLAADSSEDAPEKQGETEEGSE